jgi:hypothetical protein
LQNSLLNSLIAGKSRGDGRDQHYVTSQAFRRSPHQLENCQKSPQWPAFAIEPTVSTLSYSPDPRPIYRKSPGLSANVPVFGRLAPEIGFDRHWVAGAAVEFAIFSTSGAALLGAVSHVLPREVGSVVEHLVV